MRLSEAISLGHTLIREDPSVFYADSDEDGKQCPPCGCAIGSAAAALGVSGWNVDEQWCEETWPWTSSPADGYKELAGFIDHPQYHVGPNDTVAGAISGLHCGGMPRLEIAALIAQIEPPEPGPEASSHTPAPATVEVAW